MADGLFAQHGLDVAIDDPPGGPENILYVADGRRDACLTSVHHLLTATQSNGAPLAARFVAIIVRRSPISALVPLDSPLHTPVDLAGRRYGGSPDGAHTKEFLTTLQRRGIEPPLQIAGDNGGEALVRGDADFFIEFVDTVPRHSRLLGIRLRAIPVGLDIYSSGLLVGDNMPKATVMALRDTLVASLEQQRSEGGRGLEELLARYPDTVAAEALEGWQLVQPYIFTGEPAGSMRGDAWSRTLELLAAARGLPVPAPESIYRPEFATD